MASKQNKTQNNNVSYIILYKKQFRKPVKVTQ